MDWSTILGIVAIVAIAAIFLMRRNRPAAAGTYNDPKVQSGGSIGGDRDGKGQRTYDDPKVQSGGSIGGGNSGGTKVYDTPEHTSGGSLGRQSAEDRRGSAGLGRTDRVNRRADNDLDNDGIDDDIDNDIDNDIDSNEGDGAKRPQYNERDVKSGGSFGSSGAARN